MKQAAVYNSYDLEHLKLLDLAAQEKGTTKKIYLNLFKALKGNADNGIVDRKFKGSLTAPN